MVMFTNDSYTEVSNRVQFQVTSSTLGTDETKSTEKNVVLYPNPTKPGEPTFIKSDYPIEKIELVSATGDLLYETKISITNASRWSMKICRKECIL